MTATVSPRGGDSPEKRDGTAGAVAARAAESAGLGEVARGSTLNLAGAALSAAATLGITVLVTRAFSRPVAGAFFAATSLFLIIETVANLGAYNGLINFLARLRSQRTRGRVPALLRSAVIPVAVTSVLAAVAVLAFAEPLARLLLGGHSGSGALTHGGASPPAVAAELRALAVAIPFGALLDTYLGGSRGYRAMRPTVVVDRIGRSALQLAGVAVAALAGSAALLAPLWALPYVPAAAVAWVWFHRVRRRAHERAAARPSGPLRDGPGAPGFAGFWRFNAPRALATMAQMIIQRLDIVLVGILRGPAEAAVYTAATRFLVVGQLGNAAISMAAQPQFTHLFAIGDRRGANSVYQVTTAWLIILTWPLYLLAVVYGPQLLAVFGHSYQAGSTVMIILGLTMLMATGCGQVDMVLTTTGRTTWSLVNGLLAMAINVGLDLALIPHFGITGAAVGWAAAIAATNLVPLAQVASAVRVHPFGTGTLTACLLTVVSFGAIPLAGRYLAGDSPAVSILAVLAGCAVLLAGLWRFRDPLRLAMLPGMPAGARRPPQARRRGQHRQG